MAKKRIIILGAGLAGLSAAWHLQKRGIDCQLFEREKEVGGLCRSKHINGFTFDYSGHLLHFRSDYAFKLVKGLLGFNLIEHKRSSWVYSHGVYSRYPFQANLYGLPPAVVKECLLGFISASQNKHPAGNKSRDFLSWIYESFGPGIARHFMIPYNTKFWTVPLERLTCEWLDGFIPVPSLSEVVSGSVKESHRQFGYNSHFWYPKNGGISELPMAMAADIKKINLNCEVTEINLEKRQIRLVNGLKERFDCLISTLPLPELRRLITGLPESIISSFKKLKWNSIFNLNLGLDNSAERNRHWVYFPQADLSFFRVGSFHNFSSHMAPSGKGSLYAEVSYSKHSPLDRAGIVSRIERDLNMAGLLGENNAICLWDAVDIKYGYPIYDVNYNAARQEIFGCLGSYNIVSCGRYGSWRYMSMEDVLLEGKTISERLSGRKCG